MVILNCDRINHEILVDVLLQLANLSELLSMNATEMSNGHVVEYNTNSVYSHTRHTKCTEDER